MVGTNTYVSTVGDNFVLESTNSINSAAKLAFNVPIFHGDISGNAATATKLQRVVTIHGQDFDGTQSITAGGASSDMRIKENINSTDLGTCYNDIKKMNMREFNFKESWSNYNDQLYTSTPEIGVIAQELELINPNWVNTINTRFSEIDNLKIVKTDQLLYSAIATIKLLQGKYKSQQDVIDILENKLLVILDEKYKTDK